MNAALALNTSTAFHSVDYRGIDFLRGGGGLPNMRSCGIQRCIPEYAYPRCAREGYHLHMVMSGKGRVEVGGNSYPVREGQLFLVKHMQETFYQADRDDPWHYCWITYDGEHAQDFLIYAGFTEGVYVLDSLIEPRRFLSIVEEIVDRPNLDVSSNLYRVSLSLCFLSLAIEAKEKEAGSAQKRGNPYISDYVDYAVKYIYTNYSHVNIGDMARHIGLSRTHFSSIFKEKMQVSPQAFLMQVRMNKGKELLLKTAVPIKIVAREIGYDDQLTFSKVFKKKFGISPELYRRTHKPD